MKMGQSSSKWIENSVGKGEIAPYEQFLLFPQCFQKACTADKKKPGLVWERVKSLPNNKLLDLSILIVVCIEVYSSLY